jgi:nucleoside-diphosphate-sugar epimerase
MSTVKSKKIAILGATGHIAKNLIVGMYDDSSISLTLFARTIDKLSQFLNDNHLTSKVKVERFDHFHNHDFDVIINCIGIGDPGKLSDNLSSIFMLTETYDNLVLSYLYEHPESLYINFSSGAAYLNNFDEHASTSMQIEVMVNKVSKSDYYGISKLNSEAKHRSFERYNIVDLRIFGFFSRFVDIESKFFLTEVIRCLRTNTELLTNASDIVRDYVHPADLVALVDIIIEKHRINDAFDVYSIKPSRKFEILEHFRSRYGLQYKIHEYSNITSTTGIKLNYYSTNDRVSVLGYKPRYDSLNTIDDEYKYIETHNRR